VPTIGDRTSAAQRATDPKGWAFSVGEREALHRILGARRDIRRFRPDPVDEDAIRRVLTAGHAAPSVGHSQPWRFVLVEDPAIRARAAVLADRARLAQARSMEATAARHLLDLDLEGIREAPLGLVVCCDRRAEPGGVLGRATFVDADVWSCVCAIQNLWLAARAEGLGVGWVTLFDPYDLAALVAAPEGVVTLGWLCLGWPDERPPSPGLERRGWSECLSLGELVLRDRWPPDGDGGRPQPPISRLARSSKLLPPTPAAVVAAHDTADRILTPPGSLGVLDRAIDRILSLCPGLPGLPRETRPLAWGETIGPPGGALVIAAADHPVGAYGVSAYEGEVTRQVAEATLAGASVGAVAARQAGLEVVLVDAGVDGPPLLGAQLARPIDTRGDRVAADALSAADTDRLVGAGVGLGGSLVTAGAESGSWPARCRLPALVAVGEVGVGNTTVAAALASALLGLDPASLVGLGAGSDSGMVAKKRWVVGEAVSRYRASRPGPPDPVGALAALGGGEFAVLAGVVLGVAGGGGLVVLDGMATGVAALVALELEPAVAGHLIAGHRSREAGHQAVLDALGLEPILDVRLRAGEGTGAALAVTLLNAGLRIRLESAPIGEAAD
jgi:nicotinate-nucleotide--dimethylbenzimidazole phosphoribosyltransferase